MLRDRERDVIVESGNNPNTKGFATASILAALHPSVYFLGVGLVVVILALAAFFNRDHMEQFIHLLGIGVVVIAVLIGLVLVYKAYRALYGTYHTTMMAKYERTIKSEEAQEATYLRESARLKNELLEARLNTEKMKPEAIAFMLHQGFAQGFNVKAFGAEATSPFSNVHTLGAGPMPGQNMLGPGQPTVARPSLASLVQAVQYNSFNFALGTNVTTAAPIVTTLIDNHLKIIGASGQGKSSLVAGLLDQFTQTHDEDHLQIAILDIEDKTGRLFEADAHVKMYARTSEEVAGALLTLADFMESRYQLTSQYGEAILDTMPHIVVYFEEFLDWKKNLSKYVDKATCKNTLEAFGTLARRGRKANIHLMVCTQVNYSEKELAEAFAQFVGVNVCLGLGRSAALAAGFVETALLNENFKAMTPGRFVVERKGAPGEIGIAADYDARALLKELPGRQGANIPSAVIDAMPALSEFAKSPTRVWEETPEVDNVDEEEEQEEENGPGEQGTPAPTNIRMFPTIAVPARAALPVPTLEDAILAWNEAVAEGIELSRYTMKDRLQVKGFDCGENKARDFVKAIKAQLNDRERA